MVSSGSSGSDGSRVVVHSEVERVVSVVVKSSSSKEHVVTETFGLHL